MQAELAVGRPASEGRWPATVVARQTAHKAVRSGVLWGYVFGAYLATQALAYASSYKTVSQRAGMAKEFGTNAGISALVGPAHELQTVAGFTVWKCLAVLAVVGAVWGLLTGTRLLRGEEDAGRWELLLAGQTTRRAAAAQALAGLGCGVAALWVVTAVITVVVGRSSKVDFSVSGALFLAVAVVAAAAMFLAVGALTSQLAATRRQAASFGAVLLGISYGVRLIADAGVGLHGLIWASPLGWVEELQPLTSPQPVALLPIVAFTAILALVAVHLAGTRDAGASIVADRDHGEAHLGLLYGPSGLEIRLMRATIIGWWIAIGLSALIYGFIAKSTGATVSGSVKEFLSKLGATGTGAAAVFGLCFLIEAILIGFVAAGQVTAARSEESEGMLDHFLVRPVSRSAWLGGRLLVALVVLVLSGVAAGVLGWLGAASQHAGLSFTSLLGAGINLVPPATVILGIGVLTFGMRPRATSIVVYAVLVWSLLIVIVGGFGTVSHWVLDTSVFHHMASAPGVPPNWEANGIMTAVGVAGALVGGLAFRRRDLQGG